MCALRLKSKAYDHVVEAGYAPNCSLLEVTPRNGLQFGVGIAQNCSLLRKKTSNVSTRSLHPASPPITFHVLTPEICASIDRLMVQYGSQREKLFYQTNPFCFALRRYMTRVGASKNLENNDLSTAPAK